MAFPVFSFPRLSRRRVAVLGRAAGEPVPAVSSRLSVSSPAPQSSGDQLDGDCHHGSHQVRQSEVDPPKRDVISCQPVQAASMWERNTFERFRDRAAVLFFFPLSDEHLVTRSPLSGSNRLYSRCRLLRASTTLNQAIYLSGPGET